MEGPSCTGCNQVIEEGSVIAFGDSLFHLKCFICAKCADPVDCESNLLLLTNGRPVCESCSYCCNACKQVIRDEAIMTGDEAYHADCFQCVSCKQKIDDLVFTQTSKGIHCTPCHEKRRAEKQKRREDRERRLQQKQQAKELPTTADSPQKSTRQKKYTNANRHTSRLFDPQMVADYMQSTVKPRNNPLNDQHRRPSATDPPTPSRSRSNSVDIPSKTRLMADTRLSPSRSEVISNTKNSPNSPPLSVSSPTYPTSSASSSLNMTKTASATTLDLPDMIPSLNLSFFDNESTDLLNLTKKLGANISMDIYGYEPKVEPVIVKTTENITRASQFLESSLMTDEDYEGFPQPPTQELGSTCSLVSTSSSSSDNNVLRSELETTQSKLAAMQSSYTKIKDASRKALEEFTRAKEEFAKEVALRQQQEYTIMQLKHQLHIAYLSKQMTRSELSVVTKEEIERVAKMRVELDKTCNELKGYRNVLVMDIESLARQKQAGLEANFTTHLEEKQKALVCEIKSLHNDRDHIREEAKALEMMRDEVLHEMVMLNTKNAELTEMNNDLSRRVTEREREAAAVMAGTSFLYTPSPSLSSELNSPISMPRKSSEASIIRSNIVTSPPVAPQPPKVFKLKKKGNMFAKLSGKNSKVDAASIMYGHQHSNLTASSSLSLATPPSSSHNNSSDSYFVNPPAKKQSSESTHHGSHTFLPTSFLRPTKCDACGEKMWGLSELRCQGCLYDTHARCLSHVPQLCYGGHTTASLELPEMKLFGVDLAERARYEERSVPLIIEQCIKAVEKRGMDYEGIYRKSGGAAQMRLIHQSFNEEEEPALDLEDDDEVNDIAAVTSVLKQYFRELPNPLLPYHLYSQFIDAVSTQMGQAKTDKFFELLSQLPKTNYDTLQLLMRHLHSIQQRHSENLMTSKNLAMVFGPTLLRDLEASRDLVDMSYKNAVIEYLILHVHELLP